jgi:hypothetical protein
MSGRALLLTSLVAGLVLMVGFDATVTRILGVTCLIAFVAGGVYLIAQPSFLAADAAADGSPPESAS